jgi:hypothetical protein
VKRLRMTPTKKSKKKGEEERGRMSLPLKALKREKFPLL